MTDFESLESASGRENAIRRYGVVAVVPKPSDIGLKSPIDRDYLVIRRSASVIAPGRLCFPGGGIEAGETPEEAVCREFSEEIHGEIRVVRPIWENVTPWSVHLRWFLARLMDESPDLRPSPDEVAGSFWMNLAALLDSPDALESNVTFLHDALGGKIDLSI